jgi:DnaA family protein
MKQIALDIGLANGTHTGQLLRWPERRRRCAILNCGLGLRPAHNAPPPSSPVPTYLWGISGSGKEPSAQGRRRRACANRGPASGWLDANTLEPVEFDESWAAVLLDDVHLYTAAQQHTAFNWFVNAQTTAAPGAGGGEFAPVDLKLRDDLRTR